MYQGLECLSQRTRAGVIPLFACWRQTEKAFNDYLPLLFIAQISKAARWWEVDVNLIPTPDSDLPSSPRSSPPAAFAPRILPPQGRPERSGAIVSSHLLLIRDHCLILEQRVEDWWQPDGLQEQSHPCLYGSNNQTTCHVLPDI